MAIIGYIKDPHTIKDADKYLDKMHTLGCYSILEDNTHTTRHRLNPHCSD